MKTIRIIRLTVLLVFLLVTTFVQAQVEEKNDNGLKKSYYPDIQQISREQLIAKINKNIVNMSGFNYYKRKKGYQMPFYDNVKNLVVYDDRFQDQKDVLFYYNEIADEKIELFYGDYISNCNSFVDIHLNEDKEIMMYRFVFKSKVFAKEFAENIYWILHTENLAEESLSEADSILFNGLADKYNEMKVKPTITEEQRKYIIQANAYNSKDKDFEKSIEFYKKVISVDAVAYPAAYYNMALIYAEEGYYKSAIRNMKKYLLLVPGASDARAAQDKIYEWER